jgi:hypothetical protein
MLPSSKAVNVRHVGDGRQQRNIDRAGVYASGLTPQVLRALLAYAVTCHSGYGKIRVYPSRGPKSVFNSHGLLINKALYRLRLRGRLWAEHFAVILTGNFGFTRSTADSSLFVRCDGADQIEIVVACYIEDIVCYSRDDNIVVGFQP